LVIYYVTAARDQIYLSPAVPEKRGVDDAGILVRERRSRGVAQSLLGFHARCALCWTTCPDAYKWALLERDPFAALVRGPVVLLGDACHPMTPYMAQGAAAALGGRGRARALPRTGGRGRLEQALRLYEATRKPRTRHPGQIERQHLDADRPASGMV